MMDKGDGNGGGGLPSLLGFPNLWDNVTIDPIYFRKKPDCHMILKHFHLPDT
jgi:hypothetical protein